MILLRLTIILSCGLLVTIVSTQEYNECCKLLYKAYQKRTMRLLWLAKVDSGHRRQTCE